MLISIILAINGFEGFYFIHYYFLFSGLASIASCVFYGVLNRTVGNSEVSALPWLIRNYPDTSSIAVFGISTIVPFLLTLDVFQAVYISKSIYYLGSCHTSFPTRRESIRVEL